MRSLATFATTAALLLVPPVAGDLPGAWAETPDFVRHELVEALPILGRLDTGATEIVVRGDLRPRRARRMLRLARQAYDDINERFVLHPAARDPGAEKAGSPAARPPVDFCLFDSSPEYERFVSAIFGERDLSSYGFYMSSHRLVVVNIARSSNSVPHEMVHPLLGDDFPGMPTWFNEGLGALYGKARERRGGMRFGVNYRLRHLKAAIRQDAVPGFEQLTSSSYHDVHGPQERTYYALGRYLLLYLERRDTLDDFYRDLRREEPTPARQLALLRRYIDRDEFIRWARRLKR